MSRTKQEGAIEDHAIVSDDTSGLDGEQAEAARSGHCAPEIPRRSVIRAKRGLNAGDAEISESALIHLVEKGFSPTYGARFLKRTIDEMVKLPVTTRWKESDYFLADYEDGEMKIKTSRE